MSDVIDINHLKKILKEFANERDWEKFHTPKNLAISIGCETGELLEIFQWMSGRESLDAKNIPLIKEKTEHELADIILYIIRLADLMNINLRESLEKKMLVNIKKYPADEVKGSVEKYINNHI